MAQTYAALEPYEEQFGPFNKRYYGATLPSAGGPYTQGDEFIQTQPAAGIPEKWVCITSGSPGTWVPVGQLSVQGSVTLAQLNAGVTIITGVTNQQIRVIDFWMQFNGTFTTATDIRMSDTTPTLDIVTVAIANATTGNNVTKAGGTGITVNTAGFGVLLAAAVGVQIRKTGSSAAGGTSIFYVVEYNINQ